MRTRHSERKSHAGAACICNCESYSDVENTLTYNAGFDFTMWNGLLGMEFDAFYNYTYDILTAMGGDYPPSMGGYYYTYANYNKVDSKGVEITVSHRNKLNLAGKPFSYGASFNLTLQEIAIFVIRIVPIL